MSTFYIDPAEEPEYAEECDPTAALGGGVIIDEGDWCPRCGAPNADEDGHDPSCPLGLDQTEVN
jgi:hypothetical protein